MKKTSPFLATHIIWFFYLVSFCNLLNRLNLFYYHDFQTNTATTTYLYQWIPNNINLNFYLSLISPFSMVLLILILPLLNNQFFRILWFVLVFLIEGFKFSYDIGHDSHIYVWLSLFFALIPGPLNLPAQEQSKLYPFVRLAQLQIFLIYGLSGFWKILAIFQSLSDRSITAGADYISYAIASEFLYSNKNLGVAEIISANPTLCLALSILVFVAQAGSLVIVGFPKFYFIWGIILSMFHVGTLITLNVFFLWSVPPIMLFLCLYPMANLSFAEPFFTSNKYRKRCD